MGCWFACLRFRAEKRSSPSLSSAETTPCKSRDRLVSRNQLAAVFTPEEKGSPCEGDTGQGSVDAELKHEAKFLKACGTLLETPAELTKASQKTNIQNDNQDDVHNDYHFSLDSSCQKLQWDEQLDELPCSPASRPKRCLPDSTHDISPSRKPQTVRTYSNVVYPGTPVTLSISAQTRTRSVRFQVVEDGTGVESEMNAVSKATPQNGSNIHLHSSKYSPCSTPLKLTDEMETPGTVYAEKIENCGFDTNARIRSQYIYPLLNPMLNRSQSKLMSDISQHLGQSGESKPQLQDVSLPDGEPALNSVTSVSVDSVLPQSDKSLNFKDTCANTEPSIDNVCNRELEINCSNEALSGVRVQAEVSSLCSSAPVVSSLSERLEPRNEHEGEINSEAVTKGRSPASKSPERDRPIIGTVAAHWSSEESTRVTPKLWDGNGIPNSTNKYKEDQRVSWHATPFEERLEKALSEEKLYPPRKLVGNGKPAELEEGDEERDTATS